MDNILTEVGEHLFILKNENIVISKGDHSTEKYGTILAPGTVSKKYFMTQPRIFPHRSNSTVALTTTTSGQQVRLQRAIFAT